MARILTLSEIAGALDMAEPGWESQPLDWRLHQQLEGRVTGIMREAAALTRRAGDDGPALDFLLQAGTELGFIPLIVIANIIRLAHQLERVPEAVTACLRFGQQAGEMGYDDLCLEACSAGMMLDTFSDYAVTTSPARSRALADLYETIALRMGVIASPTPRRQDATLNVGLVVSNLVDNVAYTKTVLHFARHYERSDYTMRIYSTENLAQRVSRLFPFGGNKYYSEVTGAITIHACQKLDVPVFLTPRHLAYTDAAKHLIGKIVADKIDILVFQSGLACPIDWLTARLAPVPVKIAVNIGSFMFNRGLTATVYDNPAGLKREQEYAEDTMGAKIAMRQGTDIDDLLRQPPLKRADFNVPPEALVVGVLSNHLARRLSEQYISLMADILHHNPQLWFVAFGKQEGLEHQKARLKQRGVNNRVVWGDAQLHTGAALQMLDIYANEFPVGGSQSVIEAMACGIPVAAMRWSNIHAECAGAEAVGTNFAIPSPDLEAYRNLIQQWIDDPVARRNAGLLLSQRARADYSVANFVGNLLQYAAEQM